MLSHEYDALGNPTRTIQAPGVSGFNFATVASYDALNRVKDSTDARTGRTQFAYDGADRTTAVTDPRNLVTQSPRNGLGDATQLVSPDTGTATLTYDEAGNLKTRTDSRGVLASYDHDALNRLTGLSYTQGGQSMAYGWQYDLPDVPYGKGRLGQLNHPAGTLRYSYDAQGRVLSTVQQIQPAAGANSATLSHAVGYSYDNADRVSAITYPSGRKVTVAYTAGLPTTVSLANDAASPPAPLLSQIRWQPFGPLKSWQWEMSAGAQSYEQLYDSSGRLVRYRLANVLRDLSYDAADRIASYKHHDATTGEAQAALDQSFGYDELGRLTGITTAGAIWSIGYDANGNRTSVTLNGSASAYTTSATSNRLTGVSNPARSFSHDAAGNTTADGSFTAGYDLAGRMSTLTKAGVTTTYTYDPNGQRVRKFSSTGAASTVVFVHAIDGKLLGEYDSAGNALREFVWLGDIPVAVFTPDPAGTANPPLVFFIHTDHLNTPRIVVDRNNSLRWRWMAEPFGVTAAETNPAGLGNFTFNLRFPGQYFDNESGLHYNWHRYYDPTAGRYITSDPIGLAGGINTYAYVDSDPLLGIDPTGLVRHTTGRWIDCGKGCRIRIDYTLDERTGVVRRHLHWECKGREGVCGENGDGSHGGKWEDAPENIKECARRHGFNGAAAPAAPAPAAGSPTPSGPTRYSGDFGDRTSNPFVPPQVYDPVQERMVPATTGPSRPAYGPLPVPGGVVILP